MGASLSKITNPPAIVDDGNSSVDATAINIDNNVELVSELSYYEADFLEDIELQSFDSTLQQHTTIAISTLVAGGGDVPALSFDTLWEFTGCLLDANYETVKIILEYKKDIWNNPDLFALVEQYFESSLHTLNFCSELEKCLTKARDLQLIILVALKRLGEEEDDDEEDKEKVRMKKYKRLLDELRHFKAAGNPFTKAFQSVYLQQVSMLEKLQSKKKKLDKRMKKMKAWRKVLTVIFVSAFAIVLICSIVTAAVSVPQYIAPLLGAAGTAMAPVGKWLNSLWKDYLDGLKGRQEAVGAMHFGTYVAISDLDRIWVRVDRLEAQFDSLLENVEFALGHEEGMKFAIEKIKKKQEMFMKSIEELGKQTDRCSREIKRARTVVLQRIIRHPN